MNCGCSACCATSCGIVQEARKNAGLEVTDRIELWWQVGGSPEPAEALRAALSGRSAREVLADAGHRGHARGGRRVTSRPPTRSSACRSG